MQNKVLYLGVKQKLLKTMVCKSTLFTTFTHVTCVLLSVCFCGALCNSFLSNQYFHVQYYSATLTVTKADVRFAATDYSKQVSLFWKNCLFYKWLTTCHLDNMLSEPVSCTDVFYLLLQASNFFWGLWAILQSHFSSIDFDFQRFVLCTPANYSSLDTWVCVWLKLYINSVVWLIIIPASCCTKQIGNKLSVYKSTSSWQEAPPSH